MRKQKNRIRRIFSLLAAAVMVFAMCLPAAAAESSSDAEPATAANIDLSKEGYIEIRPRYNGTYLTDGSFSIYRVADIGYDDGSLTYVITGEFEGSGMGPFLSREALTEDEDLLKDADLVATLADYALANGIEPVGTDEVTEEARGWIRFRGVTAGLYLIVQTGDSTGFETADPFLVTFPMVGSDGAWDYYVDASTKMDIVPVPPEEEFTEVSVTKFWNDDNDYGQERPESVPVVLLADGRETDLTAELTAQNGWTYTFTGLELCDSDGVLIDYSVTELDVPEGYTQVVYGDVVNGYVITNSNEYGEEFAEIPVTKVWDDDDDAQGIRPESIMAALLADGEETGLTAELTDLNGWTYTFFNLPICNDEGKKIEYSVAEQAVPDGYEDSVSGNAGDGYVITNSYDKGGSAGGSSGGSSGKLPQTGQINWPIPLLAVGGIFFFILGWAFNRSVRREKSRK